jgi:hypothetical protein
MAHVRTANGIVGIAATGGENTYGAGDAITHLLYVDQESAGFSKSVDLFDKSTLATGYELGTGLSIMRDTSRVRLTGPACDLSIPIFLSYAEGANTTTTVDTSAYQHAITPVDCATELPSTQIDFVMASATSSTTAYQHVTAMGVVVDRFRLFGDAASGLWRYEMEAPAVYGTGGGSDISALTAPALLPFKYGKTFVKIFTTLPTAAPTLTNNFPVLAVDPDGEWADPIDWSAFTTGASIEINNDIQVNYMGAGGAANSARRGKKTVTITLNHWWDITATTHLQLPANSGNVSYGMMIYSLQNTLAGPNYYHSFAAFYPKVTPISVTPPQGPGMRTNQSVWRVVDPVQSGVKASYYYNWNANNIDYY